MLYINKRFLTRIKIQLLWKIYQENKVYEKLRQYHKALENYENILKANFNSSPLYYVTMTSIHGKLGQIHEKMGQLDKALEYYEKMLEIEGVGVYVYKNTHNS